MLAKRAIQLGGKHWHKMFHIPTDRNLSIHRRAELAIISILRDAKTLHLLLTLDILICDEIGTYGNLLSLIMFTPNLLSYNLTILFLYAIKKVNYRHILLQLLTSYFDDYETIVYT